VNQTDRYDRQIHHWGLEKQRIIEESSLLIAGVGGLGATVSQLLVRAGAGRLYLVDNGCLDWPDLNRQTLYGEKDIGRAKLPLAKERLNQINSSSEIVELQGRIDKPFRFLMLLIVWLIASIIIRVVLPYFELSPKALTLSTVASLVITARC
jgi:tRNA A37 threonylcarbamoyladenosine dehydratase